MHLRKTILLLFILYGLGILFSAYCFEDNTPINYYPVNKSVLQALGDAFNGLGISLSRHNSYALELVISNVIFFIVLKFFLRYSFSDLVYLISATLSLSFVLFILSAASGYFDVYYTAAIPLLIATFYVSFNARIFNTVSAENYSERTSE